MAYIDKHDIVCIIHLLEFLKHVSGIEPVFAITGQWGNAVT
jgi:hypothetical protein